MRGGGPNPPADLDRRRSISVIEFRPGVHSRRQVWTGMSESKTGKSPLRHRNVKVVPES